MQMWAPSLWVLLGTQVTKARGWVEAGSACLYPFTKTLIVSYKPLGWKLYLHVNSLSFKSFHPGLRLLHSLLKKFCQFTSFYLLMTCVTGWLGFLVSECAPAQLTGRILGKNCFSWTETGFHPRWCPRAMSTESGMICFFLILLKNFFYNVMLVSAIQQLWISHNYTYIPSLSSLPPLSPSHPSRSSQSTRLGSLCYTATSRQLSVWYLIVSIG